MFITFFDLYCAHQGTTIYRMFTLKKVHKLRSKMNFHREIIGMHMKEIENSANKNEKQTDTRHIVAKICIAAAKVNIVCIEKNPNSLIKNR